MDYFKREAVDEFKERVMYIGAFVQGGIPKTERVLSDELPNKNPVNENHVTLYYLGDYEDINEELFDDIMKLPDGFKVFITGYGFDRLNQGVSVSSDEFDFKNPHSYGNTKAIPHITYSWDEEAGGAPVKTGTLSFSPLPGLDGTKIALHPMAYLHEGGMVPLQYFRDRAAGTLPSMSPVMNAVISVHDQNTPFHCYDLRMHTIKVVEYVMANLNIAGIAPEMRIPLVVAAQWHDIGKLYTKTVNQNGFNEYKGHPQASAEEFDKAYDGEKKELIRFFILFHDYFMRCKTADITDEKIASAKSEIQSETPFEITNDHWRALTLLMEADESAKTKVVEINGTVVKTMESDFEKIRLVLEKITK